MVQKDLPALTKEQIAEFKDAFSLFDEDGDGTITTKELSTVMRNLGEKVTDKEAADLIAEVDVDGSGAIDFEEFCELMQKKMAESAEEGGCLEAFREYDMSGKGVIRAEELKNLLRKLQVRLSKKEIDEMIKFVDPKGTGRILFTDFVKALES